MFFYRLCVINTKERGQAGGGAGGRAGGWSRGAKEMTPAPPPILRVNHTQSMEKNVNRKPCPLPPDQYTGQIIGEFLSFERLVDNIVKTTFPQKIIR